MSADTPTICMVMCGVLAVYAKGGAFVSWPRLLQSGFSRDLAGYDSYVTSYEVIIGYMCTGL